ncbi:MAG: hypothetical protein AAGF81_00945 [Pseudomonadota bacterium]
MKTLNLTLVAAVAALCLPVLTTSASAYQCKRIPTQVKVHAPTKAASQAQSKASWTIKVKNSRGLAWSVWNIAKAKKVNCTKAGQRWVCVAKAKPCKYVVG